MSKFIELPGGEDKILVNIDNITFIEQHGTQTKIHFFGGSYFIVEEDYKSVASKCLRNTLTPKK